MHFYGKMQQYREDEGIHYIPPFLLDTKCINGVFADKKFLSKKGIYVHLIPMYSLLLMYPFSMQ